MPKYPQCRVPVFVVPAFHPDNSWPMGRSKQSMARSTSLEVFRSGRNRDNHNLEQEPDQQLEEEEDHIDTVDINSIIFNIKWSVIISNLKTPSNQVSIIVPYKIDTGSNGNIMPLHLYKRLFPRATNEQFTATKIRKPN